MKTTIKQVFNYIRKFLNKVINQMSAWFIPFACACTVLIFSCTDKYADITDWADRQLVIIDMFNAGETERANDLLYRWLSEPEVRQADLQTLSDSLSFYRTTSPDGKLMVFSWYSGEDGLVTDFNNVILYEDKGKVYSTDKCLWQLLERQHGTSELAMGEEELEVGCLTTDIHQVKDVNDRTIYITENYMFDGTWAYGSIDGFFILDGKLMQAQDLFITKNNGIRDNLQFAYYMSSYYYNIESILGPQSVFGYVDDEKQILVPTEENGECVDRYESFHFNGSKYVYTEEMAGKHLHWTLRNFESLEHLYWVADRLIRVDRMSDDTYRYTAWILDGERADSSTMLAEPDEIIHKGTMVDDKWYQFTHNDTVYRINAYPSAWHQLQILEKGKVILDETRKF